MPYGTFFILIREDLSSLKQKAVTGTIWSAIERFSVQGVQFIIGLVLARILSPSDFGLIGMLVIFLNISQSFIDGGFSSALIQKKDRDDLDYSTVFYFNIVIALIFYGVLYFSAPIISNFYKQPLLVSLTRVVGLGIIINSFTVVHRAKLMAQIDFRTQMIASLIASLISGSIGIYLAFKGYGVWALVIQTLINSGLLLAFLWYLIGWMPQLKFSIKRFKRLFSFGYKLLLSSLLDTAFKNAYTVIIGKIFSANILGFYVRAERLSNFPSMNLTQVIRRVTFPVLSELQDDDEKLKMAYRKIIKMLGLLIFPLMMGLAALAKPFILLILTEKWLESVWMLQILCFSMMWYPIHSANLNVLNVKGRSDLALKLEVIKKMLVIFVLSVSVPFGIKAMLIGRVFNTYLSLIINLFYTKKLIDYSFWQQMKDLFPVMFLSFAMALLIYLGINLFSSNLIQIIFGSIFGVTFYIGLAWILNVGDIKELKSFFKKK